MKYLCLFVCLLVESHIFAEDWPTWGKDASRNMVSAEKNLPHTFGKKVKDSEIEFEIAGDLNVLWKAKLGSQSYGNVVVSNGKVLIGTNNENPFDKLIVGDHANLYCLSEQTGEVLWQFVAPKLGSGKVGDWEFLGICSSPTVENNKAYFVTNRCEIVCVDMNGLSDGNQGYADEGQYIVGPKGTKKEVGPKDADILWVYDMRAELGVFPHNITSSSVLIHGDQIYVNTSNGVDWSHTNIPSPNAPILVCLDKNTGKLLGEEASGISEHILHGSWSSPAKATINAKDQIIFGGPDGFLYSFDTTFTKDADGYSLFKENWRIDCNPSEYRKKDGIDIKYVKPEGPSEIISTPVVNGDNIFVTIGQDPEHGEGLGALTCVKLSDKKGVLNAENIVWQYKDIKRSLSTPSVTEDFVAAGDYSGNVHLLDRKTGAPFWVHQTGGHIWGSTLIVDGKIFLGNEDGLLIIYELSKTLRILSKIWFEGAIHSSPIVANGVIYVHTNNTLFALKKK